MRIQVTENGPYLVSGNVAVARLEIVVNDAGESVAWREIERLDMPYRYVLCRCGHSAIKPYCDGSHEACGFDGTETAEHDAYFETATSVEGPGIVLRDARQLCAEARFCDRAGGLWNLVSNCDDPTTRALAEEEAALCPSGRYTLCPEGEQEGCEPDLDPQIGLVEDPHLGVSGPLWIRGRIPVFAADGESYEVRNRVTLCRCGHSANKPFCDGSHIAAGFHDEEAPSASDPVTRD